MRFYFSKNHPHKCVAPTPADSPSCLAQNFLRNLLLAARASCEYLCSKFPQRPPHLRLVNCGARFLARLELARFSAFLLFKEPPSQARRSDACGLAFLLGAKCCALGCLGNPSLHRLPNKKIGSAALPSPINFAF